MSWRNKIFSPVLMQEEDLERIHRPFLVWLACQKGISEGESRRETIGGSKTCKKEGATDTPSSQGASSFFCSQKRKEEKVNPPIFFVPGRFGGGKSLLIRKSRSVLTVLCKIQPLSCSQFAKKGKRESLHLLSHLGPPPLVPLLLFFSNVGTFPSYFRSSFLPLFPTG